MPKRVTWMGDGYRPITKLDQAKAVVLALRRAKTKLRADTGRMDEPVEHPVMCWHRDAPATCEYWFEFPPDFGRPGEWRPLCDSHELVARDNVPPHYIRDLPPQQVDGPEGERYVPLSERSALNRLRDDVARRREQFNGEA